MAKFYYYYYCCCYLCRSIVGSIIDRQYLCNLFAFERRVASIQRMGKWFVEEVYTLCSDEKFFTILTGINGVHFQDRIFVASRRIKDFR